MIFNFVKSQKLRKNEYLFSNTELQNRRSHHVTYITKNILIAWSYARSITLFKPVLHTLQSSASSFNFQFPPP